MNGIANLTKNYDLNLLLKNNKTKDVEPMQLNLLSQFYQMMNKKLILLY